jgi:predicted nucleic acid-binding protein
MGLIVHPYLQPQIHPNRNQNISLLPARLQRNSHQHSKCVHRATCPQMRRATTITTCTGHRADKDWSVTDCVSFVVMEQHGMKEALTADHHFAQAGFHALLS